MLKNFVILEEGRDEVNQKGQVDTSTKSMASTSVDSGSNYIVQNSQVTRDVVAVPRWRRKLFTKEDPIGVHKYLGIFCLLHFAFRYYQMLFGDPSAGLGTRLGKGHSWIPVACLIPHGLLSVSSLIFHTVPKERVVGMPMIWQEFRAHNIIFGLRSVLTAIACSVSIRLAHNTVFRRAAVWFSSSMCVAAMIGADIATKKLRANENESTTATMPYWEGCSIQTQKRFKTFYAYCQFMATIGCFMVTNPALPLAILLAIQIASLLMTLVRKGLLSARGYHFLYTASLVLPYLVAFRTIAISKTVELPILFVVASGMFMLRRQGVSKYLLWLPLLLGRIAFGDSILNYSVW
jgi:hypothetical protein